MRILSNYHILTAREKLVLEKILLGLKNKEIADSLYISIPTVEAHRSKVMKKMQATSLPELVKMSVYISR